LVQISDPENKTMRRTHRKLFRQRSNPKSMVWGKGIPEHQCRWLLYIWSRTPRWCCCLCSSQTR